MRALRKTAPGPGNVELVEVDRPVLKSGQILLDVAAVALCGTDRSAITRSSTYPVPRTLGHEVAGRVAAIAPDVQTDLKVGDPVTVETDAYRCGKCAYCLVGQANRCPHRKGIGTTVDGGLAEQLAMPAETVHRLPDDVPLTAGALTEPLAIAVHAVIERSPSLAGEVVVVVGPGAVGMLCAQVARAVGATVVLVGRSRHEARMNRAREMGIDHVVASDQVDVAAYVADLTDGYGAHSVFECSGAASALEDSADYVRKGGRLVLVAFYHDRPAIDVTQLIEREYELVGSRGKAPSSFRIALRLMASGQVDLENVIGEVLPVAEWEHALELMADGVKVVLTMAPSDAQSVRGLAAAVAG